MSEPVDLTITILREIQGDLREQRGLITMTAQHLLRLDRRMGDLERRMAELPSDIETMLKMELLGLRTLLDDRFERRLQELEARVEALGAPR